MLSESSMNMSLSDRIGGIAAGANMNATSGVGVGVGSGAGSGQQFLSSAGIDTQSLFRRARNLQTRSLAPKSARPVSTSGSGTTNNATNDPQTQTQATGSTSATGLISSETETLLPNLHESLDQSRASIIETILLQPL
jgi:hypothetical protein